MIKLWVYLVVGCCALLGGLGQLFFKLGSNDFKKLFIGLFLYGFATILYVWMLRYGELSSLYAVIATSYIWVLLFSYLYLGEAVTGINILGGTFIILGVYLIQL